MRGILPYSQLVRLIEQKRVRGISRKQVKPASIDLVLDDEAYELGSGFLPPQERLLPFLKSSGLPFKPFDLSRPLKKGRYYLVKLKGTWDLPAGIWGVSIIKSSLGRIDVQIRTMAEGTGRFDLVPSGFSGKLWALVVARSFNIRVEPGLSVVQLRLFLGDSPRIRDMEEINRLIHYEKLINPVGAYVDPYDGGVIVRAGVSGGLVAWQAKQTENVLDLTAPDGTIDYRDFFTPIHSEEGRLSLKQDNFYIVATKETVRVPRYMAAELVLIDTVLGEFRVNYPGFIDPGWGTKEKMGQLLTLDLRPAEDLVLVDSQPIAKLYLDTLVHPAEIDYTSQVDAHYTTQRGPRLAKWFKTDVV